MLLPSHKPFTISLQIWFRSKEIKFIIIFLHFIIRISNNLVPCTTELNKVGLHLFTSEFLIVLIVELILDEDNPKENGDEPDHRTVLVIARYA
jgi:hypothetical protein